MSEITPLVLEAAKNAAKAVKAVQKVEKEVVIENFNEGKISDDEANSWAEELTESEKNYEEEEEDLGTAPIPGIENPNSAAVVVVQEEEEEDDDYYGEQ